MLRMQDHKNTTQNYERAKELRQQFPMTERIQWNALCQLPKPKPKFRRQYPLRPYIVDFICLQARLVVEADGMSHDTRQAYDKARDDYLKKCGYTVLRFTNEQILETLEGVVAVIVEQANTLIASKNRTEALPIALSPNPSRKGRGTSRPPVDDMLCQFEED